MKFTDYKNKKTAVLGFGVEGRATAEFLTNSGFSDITVLDANEALVISTNSKKIKSILGKNYLKDLSNFDLVFITPGIKPDLPEILEAKKRGVIFESQVGLFFNLCPCPIIGVTGTKGKGTTSSLIFKMLKISGKDARLGGNIGVPAISLLPHLNKNSFAVLELSSFQLQYMKKSPHIAVVLMVTSEHLDYHKDISEYVNAKKSIVKFQKQNDFAVINYDNQSSRSFEKITKAKVFYNSNQRKCLGAYALDESIFIDIGGGMLEVCKTEKVQLRGRHNLENITAAAMAGFLAGVSIAQIKQAIQNFKGLEHRLELVKEIKGIKFYNDSFSTMPESAIAALDSFNENIILIAGGSLKGSDYSGFGEKIASKVKKVILIGETAAEIEKQIRKFNKNISITMGLKKMPDIIHEAYTEAKKGDVILLSPACASFGLFKNYKDRGNQFKKEAQNLEDDFLMIKYIDKNSHS